MGKRVKHIVSVGGGIASTLLLPSILIDGKGIPIRDAEFIVAALPNEDKDVWRLTSAVENLFGIKIKRIGHNKSPFDVFFETRFLGNSRIDPCSRVLKREVMRDYMEANHPPDKSILYVGIGAHEIDRMLSIRKNWGSRGYRVEMPLVDYPMTREQQINACLDAVGFVPRLYLMGFSHNNCGGACIKAGKKEWARLLYFLPEVYAEWETNEAKFRAEIGDYTILRRMVKGVNYPVSLTEFREEMQLKWESDPPTHSKTNLELLDGFQRLELSGTLKGLEDTPGCTFCAAVA